MATQDIFNIEAQSKFMSIFGARFSSNIKDMFKENNLNLLCPTIAIDSLKEVLISSGARRQYIMSVEELKTDPEILKVLEHFTHSLDGEANIRKLNQSAASDDSESESKPAVGLGLERLVTTGAVDDTSDNDVVLYSNYMSGGETLFRGFVKDMPTTLHDLVDKSVDSHLRDFYNWEDKMKDAQTSIAKLMKDEASFYAMFGDIPRRMVNRSQTADMQNAATLESLADLDSKKSLDKKKLAVAQHELYSKKMVDVLTKRSGAIEAKNMLGRVNKNIGVAPGGVDVGPGDEILPNARERLDLGEINEEEYNQLVHDTKMRVAEGSFGIASGIHDMGVLIQEKIEKSITQKYDSPGKSVTESFKKEVAMFGSVAGGVLGVHMGVVLVTINALAAFAGSESHYFGRMAMLELMSALDCVSIVLDIVSVVLDLIPGFGQAISLVVDFSNTLVGLIGMLVGFFADLIDVRSDKEKVKVSFGEYVESQAFTAYIDKQAAFYKGEGYDVYQYIVDGLDTRKVDRAIFRKLTDKAVADSTNKKTRTELRDASSIGRVLGERCGDDLVMAGVGADTVYGKECDDRLYGENSNTTLYGGPGNDYLNGGTERNQLFSGEGDDLMVVRPAIDTVVDGGPDSDTILVSQDFFMWTQQDPERTTNLGMDLEVIKGCCVDISQGNGRAGLSLGAVVNDIYELDRPDPIHKPAFISNSSLEKNLISLFWAGADSIEISYLSNKMLWFLAHDTSSPNTDLKYLTDGKYLYAYGKKDGQSDIWKGKSAIENISMDVVYRSEDSMYPSPGRELEALLLFAFRGTKCAKHVSKLVEVDDVVATHTQFIGDSTSNLIDIMYGYHEYVYTGNADNVVIMSNSYSPPFEMWKYIIGGNGDNTLIINSSNYSEVSRSSSDERYYVGHLFVLLEADINLAEAHKGYFSDTWSGNKVDRGIYLRNIKRIQLSAKYEHQKEFCVDATNLKEGHIFIIDSDTEYFHLGGTPGDDVIYIKNMAGTSSVIDGHGGTNLLTLENYEGDDDLNVTLGDEFSSYGGLMGLTVHATLKNIHNVKGCSKVTSIQGSNHDNMLTACGGSTEVYGKGGRNTLVSMRGCHTFEGGHDGINTYVITGPEISELMTITVTSVYNKGMKASCLDGLWENGRLTIDVLKNDSSDITLTQADIVDVSGKSISNKGMIVISNNKMYFSLEGKFNHLKDHDSETIRVKYTTNGSTATINEPGVGCVLRLTNFSNPSELNIDVDDNNQLVFQNLNGETILVDKYWANAFKEGLTNPISLINNFARRFQMVVFEKSGTVLDFKCVFSMLLDKLSRLVNQPSNTYDSIVDLASATNESMTQYSIGGEHNQILLNVSNIKLVLDQGTNFVDVSCASKQTASYRQGTVVVPGAKKTTVVLGTGREPVTVDGSLNGSISLIFKNIPHNSVDIQVLYGPVYILTYKGSVVAKLHKFTPSHMSFLLNGVMALIDNVPKYIQQRKLSGNYMHRLELVDGESKLRLMVPNISSNDLQVVLFANENGIIVRFAAHEEKAYEFLVNTKEKDADYISMVTRYQLRGGIKMNDGLKVGKELQDFVKNKLGKYEKKVETQSAPFFDVISPTKTNRNQVKFMHAAGMIVVDIPGSFINMGPGHDFIRVTASHVWVRAGEGRDTVFVQAGVQNVSVVFSAPDNGYAIGSNTLILEGVTGTELTLADQYDNKISEWSFSMNQTPVKFCKGSKVIAEVDILPTCLMFKNGDEYEVIRFGGVGGYFHSHLMDAYTPRMFMTSNGEVFLKATDVKSDTLKVAASKQGNEIHVMIYSSNKGSLSELKLEKYMKETDSAPPIMKRLYDTTIEDVAEDTVSASQIALYIVGEMPGGVRCEDLTLKGEKLVLFLLDKLADVATEDTKISSTVWSEAEARSALSTNEKTYNPTKYYSTIAENVALSLTK